MRLSALTFTLALALPANADWPQFLGPTRDSATPETIAPWTGDLKPAWTADVGPAHASPVVANGVVYAFYQRPGPDKTIDQDTLAAFDAKTGERKWGKGYARPRYLPPFGNGPRGTPAVTDGRVFTFGGTGILACWDAATGELKWKVDTLAEYKAPNLTFGISCSPLVVGKTVIVTVGGKGAGVVGFNVESGKEAWKATDDPSSYASPYPLAVRQGKTPIVFLTGSHLRAVTNLGEPLWEFPFKDKLNESSTTPVLAGDLLVGSSVTAGSVALKLTKDGPEKVWESKALTCYFSTPVPVGDHLYMVNGAATLLNPSVTLRCVETATGKVKWTQRNVGRYHAALVRTGDGKLLMLDDNGGLSLLAADPAKYTELAKAKVCGPTWAHPAVVGGRVFLRDEKQLIAVDVK